MIGPSEFLAKLTEIFRDQLDKPDLSIGMETSRDDIEAWDSLAQVRIVMGIERAYDVQLEVDEIESIQSVRGFYDAVCAHLSPSQ